MCSIGHWSPGPPQPCRAVGGRSQLRATHPSMKKKMNSTIGRFWKKILKKKMNSATCMPRKLKTQGTLTPALGFQAWEGQLWPNKNFKVVPKHPNFGLRPKRFAKPIPIAFHVRSQRTKSQSYEKIFSGYSVVSNHHVIILPHSHTTNNSSISASSIFASIIGSLGSLLAR